MTDKCAANGKLVGICAFIKGTHQRHIYHTAKVGRNQEEINLEGR